MNVVSLLLVGELVTGVDDLTVVPLSVFNLIGGTDNGYVYLSATSDDVVPVNEVDMSEETKVNLAILDGEGFASAEEAAAQVTVGVHAGVVAGLVNVSAVLRVDRTGVTVLMPTFVGQNLGARKYDRIGRSVLYSAFCAVVVGGLLGVSAALLSKPLLGIYMSDTAEGMPFGVIYCWCVCAFYFICGVMEVGTGLLRGLGKSLFSMLVSVFGVCGLRVLWIFTVFAHYSKILPPERAFFVLLLSYPITWAVTAIANYVIGFVLLKRIKKQENQAWLR